MNRFTHSGARGLNRRALTKLIGLGACLAVPLAAAPPSVGDPAPAFTLPLAQGGTVELAQLLSRQPVVLVLLRGYPGYQCPLCHKQVQDFLRNARMFADAGVQLILVYPGEKDGLVEHAREFVADQMFPPNFHLALDPGYEFTNRYDLRWNKPGETAYPSTFVINQRGVITFARISHSHGDRTTAAVILSELKKAAQ
jgi:peroxiredoxin